MRSRTLLTAMVLAGVVDLGCGGSGSSTTEGATESQASAVKKMEAETGHAWNVQYDEVLGTARRAEGRADAALNLAAMPSQATFAFLAKHREAFGIDDAAAEFSSVKEGRDEYGWTHVRLQQHVKGVPVFNGELMSHYDASGALVNMTALYFPKLRSMDVNPAFNAKDAVDKAVEHWRGNFQPTFERNSFNGEPRVRLGVYIDAAAKASLAYSVIGHIDATEGHSYAKMVMMIDAKSGAILEAADRLETVAGSGTDEFGTTRAIEVAGSGTAFTMVDSTRTKGLITTKNLNLTVSTESNCSATAATGMWDKSCVGAHYYAEVVYDYYKGMHGRDSIDNAGLKIYSRVHSADPNPPNSKQYNNAFWGNNQMTYGDGDNKTLLNLTRGLDVIAHEMTHGVTEKESGLGYATGSANGGMNESMSDIFGCLAEHWAQPNATKNWQIGEDVAGPSLTGGALRFMNDPPSDGQGSIDHAKNLKTNTDVHFSSGVSNNAFYLMTAGGTNKTSKIPVLSGIGWDKAGKVMYQTQTTYLMSSDGWLQFANANLSAAKNIGLTQNEQNIIECAWIAVGGITAKTTCADTTGGDGADGGTTKGDSGTVPPPPTDGGTIDVSTDITVPPVDVRIDTPVVIDTGVPEASTPDTGTTVDAGVRDAAADVAPDRGAAGTGGGGTGGGGTGGGGTGGGGTGGTDTGGTGGAGAGGKAGSSGSGTGGATGGTGGKGGTGGTPPSDPGCGCTVPGQSAPSSKSALALTLGFAAAVLSRRRRKTS